MNAPEIYNRRARFDFELLEEFVAGISLLGPEVKSLRSGRASLSGAFISVRSGEAFVKSFQIPKWEFATESIDPLRDRKLLLQKREITKIQKRCDEDGLTIVPLRLFWKRGRAKLVIAIAKGKKKYDKRETIKRRESDRKLSEKLRKY